MKDGRIQQADTPLNTYNRPANRFVAGFIGMPPMNFFDGTVRLVDGKLSYIEGKIEGKSQSNGPNAGDGDLTFPANGFTLLLDGIAPAVRSTLAGYVGKHVVLGIRPEHLHLQSPAGSPAAPIKVRLNVIEPLGKDMDVYMSTALHDHVVGRLEAGEIPGDVGGIAGAEMTIFVDLRRILFFQPGVTGMNLSLETTSPINEPNHALA
jgi:multiple sugar transport system ATP-binding protein